MRRPPIMLAPFLTPPAGTIGSAVGRSLVSRRRAYLLVIAACALPRLAVLLHERAALLGRVREVAHPRAAVPENRHLRLRPRPPVGLHPAALRLVPDRRSSGSAASTGGRSARYSSWSPSRPRSLCSRSAAASSPPASACSAAVIATLQPYLVWHDLHGNREILDQLLGAASSASPCSRSPAARCAPARRSAPSAGSRSSPTAACSCCCRSCSPPSCSGAAPAGSPRSRSCRCRGVVLAPWVIRNKVDVGCFAITTDARALWKANNLNTYASLAKGLWLDQVPDIPQRASSRPHADPDVAQPGGGRRPTTASMAQGRRRARVRAGGLRYEHLVFQFWEHHPGAKVKLAVQATEMLWNPRVGIEGDQSSGVDSLRSWVEPLYTVPLFLLALVGLFFVPVELRVLALIFVGYETAAAWVFAGHDALPGRPGTSCSPCSRRRRSTGPSRRSSAGVGPRRRADRAGRVGSARRRGPSRALSGPPSALVTRRGGAGVFTWRAPSRRAP